MTAPDTAGLHLADYHSPSAGGRLRSRMPRAEGKAKGMYEHNYNDQLTTQYHRISRYETPDPHAAYI